MIRVWKALKEQNLRSRLLLQVHDELLVETAEEEKEQVSAILEKEMKNAASLVYHWRLICIQAATGTRQNKYADQIRHGSSDT